MRKESMRVFLTGVFDPPPDSDPGFDARCMWDSRKKME
jgi:hypothetical protein